MGVGPAYVSLFVEAQVDAAVRLGMPPALAAELATATTEGSAALLAVRDFDTLALRRAVTSPGGVTARGLAALEERRPARRLQRRPRRRCTGADGERGRGGRARRDDVRHDIARYVDALFTVYLILIFAYVVISIMYSVGIRPPYSRWWNAIVEFLRQRRRAVPADLPARAADVRAARPQPDGRDDRADRRVADRRPADPGLMEAVEQGAVPTPARGARWAPRGPRRRARAARRPGDEGARARSISPGEQRRRGSGRCRS